MPIVSVFDFPGESIEKYHAVFEVGETDQIVNQPNRLHHVCYQTDDGFTVVDVWADEQSFSAFGEIIGPATAKAGLDARPVVYRVAGLITQTGERSRA